MAVSNEFLQYVLEQLSGVPALRARRMFGGIGLYSKDVFFGLIAEDTVYFKVDDGNRADYIQRGMQPFRPYRDRPELSMTYFAVPADTLEDAEELAGWAGRSLEAAKRAREPRRTGTRRAKR
ncbi:MAG: TfoX/Sxy family protein [Steroidobacteraceae bacterium]|nr:TfoX/Sxy family protein [Steroidobacteraceae bacterium]